MKESREVDPIIPYLIFISYLIYSILSHVIVYFTIAFFIYSNIDISFDLARYYSFKLIMGAYIINILVSLVQTINYRNYKKSYKETMDKLDI